MCSIYPILISLWEKWPCKRKAPERLTTQSSGQKHSISRQGHVQHTQFLKPDLAQLLQIWQVPVCCAISTLILLGHHLGTTNVWLVSPNSDKVLNTKIDPSIGQVVRLSHSSEVSRYKHSNNSWFDQYALGSLPLSLSVFVYTEYSRYTPLTTKQSHDDFQDKAQIRKT